MKDNGYNYVILITWDEVHNLADRAHAWSTSYQKSAASRGEKWWNHEEYRAVRAVWDCLVWECLDLFKDHDARHKGGRVRIEMNDREADALGRIDSLIEIDLI